MKNKFALMSLVFFVLALMVPGCGGGGGGSAENPVGPVSGTIERANLSGTVRFDGVPLVNAPVYLYQSDKAHTIGLAKLPDIKGSLLAQANIANGAYSTYTNQDGVYNFADIPVGQYTLIAVKDENHQFAQTGILLGSVTTVDAQLTPTGRIIGKVTATTGSVAQNIAGAFVYISGTSYIATTDVSGNFIINNVPSNALSTTSAYEVQVISGQGFASAKTGVRVNPGASTDVGVYALSVPDNGYKTITGRVVAGAGASSAQSGGHFVMLTSILDGSLSGTYSNSAGEFTFIVAKTGNYTITPLNDEFVFSPAVQNLTVAALDKASQPVSDFVFASQSGATATITGKVTTLVGGVVQNVAGAYVSIIGTPFVATSNSSGDFVISQVPANNFTASPAYEIQVNSSKGFAANKTGIKVDPAQTIDIGTFALSFSAGGYKTISGKLIAGAGATSADLAGRLVKLTSLADRSVQGTYSNSTGDFSFVVNATASYAVTAMEPGFKFNPGSQVIDAAVLDNSTQMLSDIVVVREELSRITGTVVWGTAPSGAQFSAGEVVIKNQSGTADYYDSEPVLANGLYTFYDVPAGSYDISLNAVKNGFSSNIVSVIVTAGKDFSNINLSASYAAPYVSSVTISGNILTVIGENFSNVAGQITLADAGGAGIPANNSSGWTSTLCQFDVSQLPPGPYNVQLFNPLNKAKSDPKGFVKELGVPEDIVATTTDSTISISWKNALFAKTSEIEYPANSGTVFQVTENAFSLTNLAAGNSYSLKIRHKFNNSVSAWVTSTFSTKATGLSNIPAYILNSSAAPVPSTATVFGFQVNNNVAYIAFKNGSDIHLRAYDTTSHSVIYHTDFTYLSDAGQEMLSLAVSSTGVYLTSVDSAYGDPHVIRFNRDFTAVASQSLVMSGFSLGAVSLAKVYCYADKVFLLTRETATNVTVAIRELDASLNVVGSPFITDTAQNSTGNSACLAYDSVSNNLFLAAHETVVSNTVSTIRSFNAMNLASPTLVGSFTYTSDIIHLSAGNNGIFCVFESTGPLAMFMFSNTGYSGLFSLSVQNACVDKAGRIWMYEQPSSNPGFFNRYDSKLNLQQSLKTITLLSKSTDLSQIQIDPVTGIVYMLHGATGQDIAVYQYDSNY